MALFVGGISSFRFWRAQLQMPPHDTWAHDGFAALPAPSKREVDDLSLGLHRLFGPTIDLCVGSDCARRRLPNVRFHIMTGAEAAGWFVSVTPNVYVAKPELCFAQMAQELSSLQLAKWGMELCGRYRFDELRGSFGARSVPLASAQSITTFLEAYSGRPGARRAKRLAHWLVDGSASLRESQLALHFCVPRRRGGNGLGIPVLNFRIDIDPALQRIANKTCYYVDQYWPEHRLAVEYESDAYHSSAEQAAADRDRRNMLQRLGIHVITVNTRQLIDLKKTDDIAAQILQYMHRRQKSLGREWEKKHRAFHNELLTVDRELHL